MAAVILKNSPPSKKHPYGKRYFVFRVYRGPGRPRAQTTWDWPDGWSEKAARREAHKRAAEFEQQVKNGEYLDKKEKAAREAAEAAEAAKILTVEQYAERVFLPAKAVTRSEKTVSSYRWTFRKYINPALGRCKLTEVTSAQVTAFLLDFQATGAAHSSVGRLYAVLNSFFKMAYMDESIDRNPMDRVQKPEPRKDELKKSDAPEAYTAEEVAGLLECLKENDAPLKWQAYISVLCDTGIRRGEGVAIRWTDINFTKLEIDINGSMGYTPERGVYRSTPKSRKTRIVDITPETAALLRRLRAEQSERCISEYVFTQDGAPLPMHPDTPNRYMKAFGKRYGIENFHPHKLRHSYASIAITNGEDIVSVSENLGHSDTSITLRTYSHANEESRKRANAGYHKAIEDARGQSKSKSG